jgi:hypothetical protein
MTDQPAITWTGDHAAEWAAHYGGTVRTDPGCLCVTAPGEAIAEGVVIIRLPGLAAIRIDTQNRFIAIDGISGPVPPGGPLMPQYLVHDLRGGTYGDFHRLLPAGECSDPAGCSHIPDCDDAECGGCGQHIQGAYAHRHETIEDVTACEECMIRAADLRHLSGN